MAHTFTKLLVHVVFSTKGRMACICGDIRARLFPYMGGIIRELGGKALAINGADDHVHLLLSMPPTISIADAMRVLKTNSSRWAHENGIPRSVFGWQTGYSAFSVSQSNCGAVSRYIQGQEQRHRKVSFHEELLRLLERHGVEYDERYIWE